jgi:hypothetical protein
MLAEAFNKLMRTDRREIINTGVACWVGHAVGPLWYFSEGYSISTNAINRYDNDGIRRVNMEKVEWLVRCGLYHHIPKLKEEVEYILNNVNRDGIFEADIYVNEFRGWGPYAGLQLETDWKSKIRKACDITFRALLILHYAENT